MYMHIACVLFQLVYTHVYQSIYLGVPVARVRAAQPENRPQVRVRRARQCCHAVQVQQSLF